MLIVQYTYVYPDLSFDATQLITAINIAAKDPAQSISLKLVSVLAPPTEVPSLEPCVSHTFIEQIPLNNAHPVIINRIKQWLCNQIPINNLVPDIYWIILPPDHNLRNKAWLQKATSQQVDSLINNLVVEYGLFASDVAGVHKYIQAQKLSAVKLR